MGHTETMTRLLTQVHEKPVQYFYAFCLYSSEQYIIVRHGILGAFVSVLSSDYF